MAKNTAENLTIENDSSEIPRNCTFTDNDWHVLASFWHPVAFATELGAEPKAVTLLDQPVVLYRTSDGISAAKDLCPHRGTRLSGGWTKDNNIVCPYHGISFDSKGKCTSIPSAGKDAKIPSRLCIKTYLCEERYGVVWVCMKDQPLNPIPTFKEMGNPALQRVKMDATWNVAAGRHLENFADTAHFSWIHRGTFGDVDNPQVPSYKVEKTDTGLFYRVDTIQQDGSVFGADPVFADVPSEYAITYPFTTHLKLIFPRGDEDIFDMICPVSSQQSHIFMIKCRDHDLDQPTDEWAGFQVAVNEEDRKFVESQYPQELPVDLSQEFHIASDAASVAYRRGWVDYGLKGPII